MRTLSSISQIFSAHELSLLNKAKIPKHIAIIPDGNRRWAMQRQLKSEDGHNKGGNVLIETVKAACELDIKVITFFLFSTENWARPQLEVDYLMWLLNKFLIEQLDTMLDYGIRMRTIGTLDRLPEFVQTTVNQTKAATEKCDKIDMVLAINYGGRDEICRAVKEIVRKTQCGELSPEAISEDCIAEHLDTAAWEDPELLIRTSGELRISNYLLWQLSYSEIYVADILWPNFRPQNLLEAILNYQTRQRRLGKQ